MGIFSGVGKAIKGVVGSVSSLGSSLSSWAPLLGTGLSYLGQRQANQETAASTAEQMAFQERMRATQYQTSVADLKKAGLNPMLAYHNGGAGTPAGASYKAESETKDAVNSGLTAALLKSQIEKMRAETDQAESSASNQRSQALLNNFTVDKVEQETMTSAQHGLNLQADTRLKKAYEANALLEFDKIRANIDLTREQANLVRQEIKNAVLHGGKIQADTGNVQADTVIRKLNARLLSLDIPRAVNVSEAQKSTWMKNVSTYLNDVLRGTSSAGSVRNMFRD